MKISANHGFVVVQPARAAARLDELRVEAFRRDRALSTQPSPLEPSK